MTKKDIRAEKKRLRGMLSEAEIARLGEAISKELLKTEQFKASTVILSYYAFAGEVSLAYLHKEAAKAGKRIALPVCLPGNRMEFRYVTEETALIENAYHIPEPLYGELVVPDASMLLIVPGVSFDGKCNRIGYGGGFYDRFMAEYPALLGVMPAYEFQKTERIPTEDTDKPVAMVVTEKRCYRNAGIGNTN